MKRFWEWCSADFLSPKDFVRHAALIVILFGLIHLCGLRDFTSMLNGTSGSLSMDSETGTFLGVVYVLSYLAAILIAPTLLIAAGLLAIWHNVGKARTRL